MEKVMESHRILKVSKSKNPAPARAQTLSALSIVECAVNHEATVPPMYPVHKY